MTRFLLACALWLAALVVPASAQGGGFGFEEPEIAFELYHRIDGDEVQIAIRTTVKRKWHVYHDELGQPDSVGQPTVVEFDSDSAYFYPVILPEPKRAEQAGLGKDGRDTWIWEHGGRFVIHGLGELDDPEEAEAFEFTAHITGQVCDEGGMCIPFDETLTSKGAGPDAVWEGRPTLADFEAKDDAADAAAQQAAAGASDGALFDQAPEQVDAKQLRVEMFLREDGDVVEAVVAFDMDEHWHIGHATLRDDDVQAPAQPTKLQLVGEGVRWGEVVFPEPYTIELGEGFPWFYAHEGRVLAYARGEKTGDVSNVAAWYAGQVCEDGGVCIEFSGVATPRGAGSDADFAAARAGGGGVVSDKGVSGVKSGSSGGGRDDSSGGGDGLLQFILLAIGGGLFALVMPCTYPMIPITISFFTKQADARGGSVLPLSLAYGAGIVLIFVLIGVVLGPPIIVFATHWATNLIIGLAFLFFALALFGAINLQPPAFLMSAAGKASMQGGYAGVFLMGATLVVTSFTCTAPFVGTLLAAGATSGGGDGDLWRIALGMGVFGLTMAIPFFFLSLVPGRVSAMPKGGEWMNTIKVTLGFVEVAAALKFISNADIVLEWGVLSRELFLLLWATIFVLAAAYLFGFIQIKGKRPEEIGAARSVFAIGFVLFGVYCWHGYTGHQMDNIMTALAPPYSSRIGGTSEANGSSGASHGGAETWTIVKDDYERARSLALAQGKPLFLNFTGHT